MKNVMSKLVVVVMVLSFSASTLSCSASITRKSGTSASKTKVPPGQAKKANGDKSAKKYTPSRQ